MRTRAWLLALGGIAGVSFLLLLGSQFREEPPVSRATSLEQRVKELDAAKYQGAKETLADKDEKPGRRAAAIRDLVFGNAREAPRLIAGVLDDREPEVSRAAAEWLALYGDKRGLDKLAECVETVGCKFRFEAVRFLGISRRPEYAAMLAEQVRPVFQKGLRDGEWHGSAEDRALLMYGAIALARMGRREDWDLILQVVAARPHKAPSFLHALGYIDDPRSRDLLWSAYKEMLRTPTCEDGGMEVSALIELSRLGETVAIEQMNNILLGRGTPPDVRQQNGVPVLCHDRSEAFGVLRSRDSANFAETVFQVAAQQPEGPGTRSAWDALKRMAPKRFGQRVLKLAVSKKPHWKLVTRDTLNNTVIAIEPSLNEAFWAEFEVEFVPEMRGEKTLVEEGLGRFLSMGSWYWTDD